MERPDAFVADLTSYRQIVCTPPPSRLRRIWIRFKSPFFDLYCWIKYGPDELFMVDDMTRWERRRALTMPDDEDGPY